MMSSLYLDASVIHPKLYSQSLTAAIVRLHISRLLPQYDVTWPAL